MDGGWAIARTTTAALTMRLYDQLRRSEDAREGRRAFAEKRQPQWQER
jgi:1,4-dihydroxy-2-naphthoyl-CoA synthase